MYEETDEEKGKEVEEKEEEEEEDDGDKEEIGRKKKTKTKTKKKKKKKKKKTKKKKKKKNHEETEDHGEERKNYIRRISGLLHYLLSQKLTTNDHPTKTWEGLKTPPLMYIISYKANYTYLSQMTYIHFLATIRHHYT